MKKLEMQDLENVSGGVNYDNAGRPMSQDTCPSCGFPGLIQTIDWDIVAVRRKGWLDGKGQQCWRM